MEMKTIQVAAVDNNYPDCFYNTTFPKENWDQSCPVRSAYPRLAHAFMSATFPHVPYQFRPVQRYSMTSRTDSLSEIGSVYWNESDMTMPYMVLSQRRKSLIPLTIGPTAFASAVFMYRKNILQTARPLTLTTLYPPFITLPIVLIKAFQLVYAYAWNDATTTGNQRFGGRRKAPPKILILILVLERIMLTTFRSHVAHFFCKSPVLNRKIDRITQLPDLIERRQIHLWVATKFLMDKLMDPKTKLTAFKRLQAYAAAAAQQQVKPSSNNNNNDMNERTSRMRRAGRDESDRALADPNMRLVVLMDSLDLAQTLFRLCEHNFDYYWTEHMAVQNAVAYSRLKPLRKMTSTKLNVLLNEYRRSGALKNRIRGCAGNQHIDHQSSAQPTISIEKSRGILLTWLWTISFSIFCFFIEILVSKTHIWIHR